MILGMQYLDAIIVVIYLAGITLIGALAGRSVKSREDYLVGGRRFNRWFMLFHAFGTGTHSDQAAGVVAESYKSGLSGIWAQWNWMISTPFYWLLAPLIRRLRCLTVADVYRLRYGRAVSAITVIVSSIGACMAMGVMLNGTSRTVQGLLHWKGPMVYYDWMGHIGITQAEPAVFYIAMGIITLLFVGYGIAGGIVGAIRTDLIQGIMIILLSFLALPFALGRVGGMSGLREALEPEKLALISSDFSIVHVIGLCVVSLFSIVSQAHIVSVTSAGKNELEGRIGMTYGNFLKRFCTVGWCLLGIAWFVTKPDLANPDTAFGDAVGALLPVGFAGLMIATIMAAAMSTCDSMMVAVSGLISENIYGDLINPKATERQILILSRVVAVLVVVLALYYGVTQESIFGGLKSFWEVTGTIGVAFWLGVLWRRMNAYGAIASFVVASGTRFLLANATSMAEGPQLLAWLGAGILAGVVVSFLTPPPSKEHGEDYYVRLYTRIGDEERLEKPLDEAIPRDQRLIDVGGIFLPKPSRETLNGFLVAWVIVAALLIGAILLFRPPGLGL
jgi:Na+/proline symporter